MRFLRRCSPPGLWLLKPLAAAINIDPVTTRWTFGAHEPYTMYRRVGNHCTGGIDGNALWVKDWLTLCASVTFCRAACR